MIKISFKKLAIAMSLSLTMALTVPSLLPVASNITTVEAASAKISQKSATILTGQTLKLKVSNKGKNKVTWSTSNKKVATVKNGTVTALSKGNVVITAKVGSKKLKCKVTVKNNSYSFNTKFFSEYFDLGDVYFMPSSVYYKNGKLYSKIDTINKTGYTIRNFADIRGNAYKKLNISLKAYTYSDLNNDFNTYTELAKGNVKVSLPKNIANNNSKSFTVEFSGNQIKKKGFDLSSIYIIDSQINQTIYYYKR